MDDANLGPEDQGNGYKEDDDNQEDPASGYNEKDGSAGDVSDEEVVVQKGVGNGHIVYVNSVDADVFYALSKVPVNARVPTRKHVRKIAEPGVQTRKNKQANSTMTVMMMMSS